MRDDTAALSLRDRWFLSILSFTIVGIVVKMAIRDLHGPELEACMRGPGDSILSKHLHCVSRNGTHSFADFLAVQGAKKEHPYYAAERARLRGSRSHANADRTDHRLRLANRSIARLKPRTAPNVDDESFIDPRVIGDE